MSIIDRPRFSASDPAARDLLDALVNLYPKEEPVEKLIQNVGYRAGEINWNGPMVDVWPRILEQLAGARKLRELVQFVSQDPDNAAYSDLFSQLLSTPPPGTPEDDPFRATFMVAGNRPFMDRRELRQHLKELEGDFGSRVLVVSGPQRSGKSYSWYLISHIGDQRGSYESYLIDLGIWSGPQAGPAEVMNEITGQMGWDPPPVDPTAQEDTVARILLGWFKGRIRKEPVPRWLIFDGLSLGTVSLGAIRLIENVAVAAERREVGELRVVLLDFDRPLPVDVDPYTLRDQLVHLDVQDIRDFFQRVAQVNGQQIDNAGLEELIGRLLGPPPHPVPLPLWRLAPRLRLLVRALTSEAVPNG
jgi:hypothetical protein